VFRKGRLRGTGVEARALVLEKNVFASGYSTNETKACRYKVRVQFDDGSTSEATLSAWNHELARALVGDLIPVRYDPADRSKIEIDSEVMKAQRAEQQRELSEQAIERGEQELDRSLGLQHESAAPVPSPAGGAQVVSAAADRRARKQAAREAQERKQARRAAQVEKLDRQHTQGLLTDEEHAAKMARIMGSH
jgi:hypothetical protein